MFIGTISAVVHGAALPVMFIVFGDTTTAFTYYELYKKCGFSKPLCTAALNITDE